MTICIDYSFSPYFSIILLSFALSYIFIFAYSKSRIMNKKHVLYSMLLHFVISMYCGFMFTYVANIMNGKPPLSQVGLSGMGGMIGTIISIISMGFIFKEQKDHYLKCYIMSLPLIYGISKMACFLVGCCYGMPYDGPFCIKYISQGVMTPDHSVFPVQAAECIAFVILSLSFYYPVCHSKSKNTVLYEIICCCILKFSLDYLRERPNMSLSVNQKACILVSLITLIVIAIQTMVSTKKAAQQ